MDNIYFFVDNRTPVEHRTEFTVTPNKLGKLKKFEVINYIKDADMKFPILSEQNYQVLNL